MERPVRLHGLEFLDARKDPPERPVPFHFALRQEFVRAPRGDEPGILAVLPDEQIGTGSDLAVVDHLEYPNRPAERCLAMTMRRADPGLCAPRTAPPHKVSRSTARCVPVRSTS